MSVDDAFSMFLCGVGGVFIAEALGWWAILFLFGLALIATSVRRP